MIQANELRVGNWVYTTNKVMVKVFSINSPKPLKKSSLSDKWIIELFDNGLFDASIDDIQPIPLNEDWLVKFGFERGAYDIYWLDKHGLDLGVVNTDLGWRVVGLDINPPIDYVHLFQNLYYFLTGKELELQSSEL